MMKPFYLASVTLLATLSLAACSSSSSSPATNAPSGSGSGAGSGSASGSPINVLATGEYTGTGFGYPEMADGAKAAVQAANAAGGINGHPIKLTTCDDKGDPNVAAACARQAVTDKDVAVLGSIGLYAGSITPLLEAAKIPYIGALPVVAQDTSSPIAYPVDGGVPVNYAGEAAGLVKAGCNKIGILVSETSASGPSTSYVIKAASVLGASITKTEKVPTGAPDFTPYVAALLGSHPQCVALILSTVDMVKAITGFRQSTTPKILLSASLATLPPAVVTPLKGAADGIQATASAYLPSAKTTPTFIADLKAENPKAPVDNPAETGWSAAQTFIEVAKNITGDITASSLLSQLGKTTALKLETYPAPIDLSKTSSIAGSPHLFNFSTLVYVVKGNGYVLRFPSSIDLSQALSAK